MAVPFGFSVGDFIAGIGALATTIKAVRAVGGSATQYQAIASELETLKNVLSSAQSLDREQRTGEEYRAVCEAAVSCEGCINSFVMRIAKYQPWLKPGTEGWKAALRKIQWAFCNMKDLADFRQQLTQQTSTICLKILVLQTKENQLGRQVQEKCQNMMTEIQFKVCRSGDLLEDLSPRQLEYSETIQQLILQNQRLLKTNQELGEQNGLLLSRIWETQQKLSLQQEQIPPQVLLQQPVRLLDACDYVLHIHLDFIDSVEAFLAVIKVKFRERGVSLKGISKVDRLEFTIRAGQKELPLNRTWQALFRPGQIVNMSMKFRRLVGETTCPGCRFENETNENGEVKCARCKLLFRRVIEIQPPHMAARSLTFPGNGTPLELPDRNDHPIPTGSSSSTDELKDFRRVDIVSSRPHPHETSHDSVSSRKRKYKTTGHSNDKVKRTMTTKTMPSRSPIFTSTKYAAVPSNSSLSTPGHLPSDSETHFTEFPPDCTQFLPLERFSCLTDVQAPTDIQCASNPVTFKEHKAVRVRRLVSCQACRKHRKRCFHNLHDDDDDNNEKMAGVISRRIQTGRGGQQGPHSTRDALPASKFRRTEPKEEPVPAKPRMDHILTSLDTLLEPGYLNDFEYIYPRGTSTLVQTSDQLGSDWQWPDLSIFPNVGGDEKGIDDVISRLTG